MMTERKEDNWEAKSQSFDSVAGLYDDYRPGYPAELIDSIVEFSNLPKSGKILEIGCGTGKATLVFAQGGYSIHCIEPGANLVALAINNLQAFPNVTFEIGRFEDLQETACAYDLVISAQAFHWVPKEIGYVKAERALKPHGHLALFWNMNPGSKESYAADLDKVYQEIAPEMDSPLTANDETIQQRIRDIEESGCFGPVTVRQFPWSKRYYKEQYLGLLNTYSDHILLSKPTHDRLLHSIGEVIEKHGGSILRTYTSVLFMAEKN